MNKEKMTALLFQYPSFVSDLNINAYVIYIATKLLKNFSGIRLFVTVNNLAKT